MNVVDLIINGHLKDLLPYVYIMFGLWATVVGAVLVDFWSGINRAKVCKEDIESKGFRRTVSKMGDYWRIQVMAATMDIIASLMPWYNRPWASMLIALGVVLIEGRSVWENSRAKKSEAAKIPAAVRDIIKCSTTHDAEELLEHLKNGYGYENKSEVSDPDKGV